MHTHSKPDLAVTALLQNLNDELDRKKMKKVEDLMLAKMQSSVRGRLGPRINEQHVQISHRRGGGKLCGAIFMCNRRTWKECLGQCLFGLPIGKKSLVEQVIPGMKLFLFEYERRQLWGVFEAASYGGMDIIPSAYTGGSFPCQVRVNVPEECVALYEEEFCNAIRDNYFSLDKFHFDLSEKQVCHLTSLFERKYVSANILHSNLLECEDKRCIMDGCKSNGGLPLLLTNDDGMCLYPDESLQNSWYSSSCQVTNDPFLFSEEGRDHPYRYGESRTRRKGSEKGSLISLPNGALDIVQSDVASLTDFSTQDTILFPDNVPRLHSDRPIAKSVWARISGHPKSIGALEPIQVKSSSKVIPDMTLPTKVCTILEIDVEDDSMVQDADPGTASVSEEAAEEFLVGFKRRRGNINNASTIVDETPRKQRRKLTRPSFEDVADEHLVELGEVVAGKTLPSARGALDFQKRKSPAEIVEDFASNMSVVTESPMKLEEKVFLSRDIRNFNVSDPGEGIISTSAPGCKQGNGILQADHDFCQPNTLDLNLPVEASLQNDQGLPIGFDNSFILKDEKQSSTDVATYCVSRMNKAESSAKLEQCTEPFNEKRPNSLVCEMQEPCCLALSLATQSVLHSREDIDDSNLGDLTGHLQKHRRQTLVLVEDAKQDKHLMDGSELFIGQQCNQRGSAGGEGVESGTGFLGKEEQVSDLQPPHISSESTSLGLAAADSLRENTLSLAPCTPAIDFIDSSHSVSDQCDERKGCSHDLAQDIPLTLELGSGVQLPDVKLGLHDIIHPQHAFGNLHKREDGDNAGVHDESSDGNQGRECSTIALDGTSGSNLLHQDDLKSFLSGLQVSGIRLQLGASPCLILQLGDLAGSTSNVDSQDQGGATAGQPEPS